MPLPKGLRISGFPGWWCVQIALVPSGGGLWHPPDRESPAQPALQPVLSCGDRCHQRSSCGSHPDGGRFALAAGIAGTLRFR